MSAEHKESRMGDEAINDARTPLEEFEAERRRQIEEGARLPGGEGAMCRLMQRLDTAEITDWIDGEFKRGSAPWDIQEALANWLANAMAPYCLGGGRTAQGRAVELVEKQLSCFFSMCAENIGVIAVHRYNGNELEVTSKGIATKGMPR